MTVVDPGRQRELVRLADALGDCASRLGADVLGDEDTRVDQVRRILAATAVEVHRHVALVRRLQDEIDLVTRRGGPAAPELRDLVRRREEAQGRLTAHLDASTRALLPGGDRLDATTILRRLGGTPVHPVGRVAVDRPERLRAITALLRRGARHRRPAHPRSSAASVVTVLSRHHRLARLRRRLRAGRSTTTLPEVTP